MIYDFNELRRTIRKKCKKRVTFKKAAFLQKIIDKDRWTDQELCKMIKGDFTWIPDIDMSRNYVSDALTFASIVNDKTGNDFEYIRCVNTSRKNKSYCIIIFSRRNLKESARRIRKMSKLKAFL